MKTICEKELRTYEEYKTYVYETWELGDGNELWESNLIVETPNEMLEGKDIINYRLLTKEEFENFDIRDYTEGHQL